MGIKKRVILTLFFYYQFQKLMPVRTVGAMRMAVGKLIGGSFTNGQHFDGKMQVLPSHRVIEVYHHGLRAHLGHFTTELVALIILQR